jgi:hypothetical protein
MIVKLIVILYFMFLYFRHVSPSFNNLAAKSLNKDVTIRSLQKVRVSAQLSFGLFILEVIGQLTVFFLSDIVQQHTLAEYAAIMWYFLMVPCTF